MATVLPVTQLPLYGLAPSLGATNGISFSAGDSDVSFSNTGAELVVACLDSTASQDLLLAVEFKGTGACGDARTYVVPAGGGAVPMGSFNSSLFSTDGLVSISVTRLDGSPILSGDADFTDLALLELAAFRKPSTC